MTRAFMWVASHVRAFLGLDWIDEAREITEESKKRHNVVETQFRPRKKEDARREQ